MADPQVYGDISPRTAAYAVAPLLKRHDAEMVFEKFGQTYPIPTKSTKVAIFRRYDALGLATTALVEGVTPSGSKPTITDYTATLEEFGDFIPYSGFMLDTHEDPILKEYGSLCVQQAAETVETLRYNKLKAGTNVGYANGGRSTVNTVITLTAQRTATAALLRQRGHYHTEIVSSNPSFSKESIEAAFIGVVHPDVSNDIRNMEGFIPTKNYGTTSPWSNEIGSVEDVRYVRSILCTPFPGESGVTGGAKGAMRAVAGDGVAADVYPVLYLSKDAYGIVPLKGTNALALIAHNPGSSGTADPLNQRGTLGWKTATTTVILNQLWIYRLEVAVTA
jgi:N4-gp56 family major capsid protein